MKQVKLKGKNTARGAGKTPFCGAKAQVFVGHTGTTRIKGGTIRGPGSK